MESLSVRDGRRHGVHGIMNIPALFILLVMSLLWRAASRSRPS